MPRETKKPAGLGAATVNEAQDHEVRLALVLKPRRRWEEPLDIDDSVLF